MSAQPAEPGPSGPWRPTSAPQIRRALPEDARPRFDEALDRATLAERPGVLLLWSAVVRDLADPAGDAATQAVIDGTSQARTWEEWEAEGAL
ncbi:hypothetical protein [Streptomyces flavofungini]|uniref:hypothetical protein n=1 Tax=Streptomyces flavofungini TaxID=68200 RepID=UPI0025AF86A8|nr:hypothetical protein [Streptomyces flavofungini]WJV51870.1 hypothetical protein QUY26_40560 [Streptomyces flavofungini]